MYDNKLLNRQIRKYLRGAPIPKEMEGLLAIIGDAYDHYEENLSLLQRAIELSSVELNQAKNKIGKALSELNEKNEDLLSSIHYARLIQNAILPSEERFKKVLPGSFVFHRPRDIVSGDFYWLQEYEDKILVAAESTLAISARHTRIKACICCACSGVAVSPVPIAHTGS